MSIHHKWRTSVAIVLLLSLSTTGRSQVLLTKPGPLERQAKPITPENPIPKRVYFAMPTRPVDIDVAGGSAVVTLRVTLDAGGSVAEIRSRCCGLMIVGNGLAVSDAFIEATADAVSRWRYEPPAEPPISFDVRIEFGPDGKSSLAMHGGMALPAAELPTTSPPPPPPSAPAPPWVEGAVRVGSVIAQPTKTKHVPPVFPPEAIAARLQGVVILEARVEHDGHIQNARVLRSIPLLDQAALAAVLQWEFSPTLLNGSAVPVLMTVTVQFTLPEP
jgi:TonB family protein